MIKIDSKIQMFLDKELIEKTNNVDLLLHNPIRAEIAISFNEPWEGTTCCYGTVIYYENKYMLYYRGATEFDEKGKIANEYTCVAFSDDGKIFYKPELNIIEYNGSTKNNLILEGGSIPHNFSPFVDTNPNATSPLKAVGGHKNLGVNRSELFALESTDGVNWTKIKEEAFLSNGMFDSQNIVFYDSLIEKYRCYSRYFDSTSITNPVAYEGFRAIQSCTSSDFINWDENIINSYTPDIMEHFYTNATVQCPGAEHVYLSFPKRFVPSRSRDCIDPTREGVSDAVIITSNDGINWDRTFMEAYVRPGLDLRNWVNRNNMMLTGMMDNEEKYFSQYISENYRTDTNRIRRLLIRKYGFASMNAKYQKGSFITKTLSYTGSSLYLNFSTSAIGYVKVSMLDKDDKVLATSNEIFGDEIFEKVIFSENIKQYENCEVKLKFEMQDSDLFAFRFGE